jgi:ABC-type transporter MlaC component
LRLAPLGHFHRYNVFRLDRDAVAVLGNEHLDQAGRTYAFRHLPRLDFDLPTVSRFVLSHHWRCSNSAEREDFIQLFEDYVVATYGRRLGHQRHQILTANGQRAGCENGVILHRQIVPETGPAICWIGA